jgi:hypothetical protein
MKRLLTIFVLSLILLSCKKDKDDNNESTSKTTLLTQKTWKPVNVQKRSTTTDPWETNNFSMQACALDNIWTFSTNGSYLQDDGLTSCSSSTGTIDSGTWNFNSDETHMTIIITSSGINLTEDCTIEQLDENTLIYNFYFPTGPYYRYTMSH